MFAYAYRTDMVQPICRFITHLIVYSSLYTSILGVAMVYISCMAQGLPFDPVAAALMMLVTFSVYNLNRKTDEDEDAINHAERYAFTKEYGTTLFRSAVGAYIVALCLSILQGPGSLLITAIPLVAGVVYSVPLFPAGFGFRRLKEVPIMKSLLVAFSWAVPPVLLPVCHAAAPADTITVIVGVFLFIQAFTNTVVFDMRDVEGDIAAGVKTIPAILGIRRTLLLFAGVNLVLGAVLVLTGTSLLGSCTTALALVAGVIYTQGYLLYFHQLVREKLLFELLVDGQFLVLGGIFCLLTLVLPYPPI